MRAAFMNALPTKNKFFFKLILGFSVVSLAVIALLAAMMLNRANRIMLDEISNDSQYRLEKMRDLVESSILSKYQENTLGRTFSLLDRNSNGEMMFFLQNPPSGHLYRVRNLVDDLNMFTLSNDEISNVSIYFKDERFAIDKDFYYENVESYPTPSFLYQIPGLSAKRWFARTITIEQEKNVPVLTYVLPLPYGSNSDTAKGFIFLDVRVDYLQGFLKNMLSSSGDILAIVTNDGIPLLQTGSIPAPLMEQTIKGIHSKTDLIKSKSNAGTNVLSFLPSHSSGTPWKYVLIRPVKSINIASRNLEQYMINICLVALVVGLAFSLLLSYRFQRPMRRIISKINGLPGVHSRPASSNEYDLIDLTLDHQRLRIEVLKDQLYFKQIAALIAGDISGMYDLPSRFFHSSYVIVSLTVVAGQLTDLKRRVLGQPASVDLESISINTNELVFLYLLRQDQSDPDELIRTDLEAKTRELSDEVFVYHLGVGTKVDHMENINVSYQHAKAAQRYSFLFGTNKPVFYAQIQDRNGLVDSNWFESWNLIVKAGNAKEVNSFLIRLNDLLHKEPIHIDAVELALMQIGMTLSRYIMENKVLHAVFGSELIAANVRRLTLEDSIDWIRTIYAQIAEALSISSNHAYADQIGRLKQLIETNFNQELSLDYLADSIKLSPSYVSTLFKEIQNVTISEYLAQVRLEKAAELLQCTLSSVSEISHNVGYSNVQYFCTKFKQKFGVTPIQFRKASKTAPVDAGSLTKVFIQL